MTRIAIIGGGITGLAAAHHLRRIAEKHGEPFEPLVFERETRWGGKILTWRESGFIVEGGPDSFFSQKTDAADLCRELGLGGDLIPSNDATYHTRVLWRGRLRPYPAGFRLAVPTRLLPFLLTPLLTPWGKLRIALEPLIPPRRDPSDESLARFVRRRLGREALDRLAGPIMGAIYVSRPEEMSVRATFPMFLELEQRYGSLLRGIRAARRAHGRPGAIFTTLREGMDQLVRTLVRTLGPERLAAGSPVEHIERRPDGWRIYPAGRPPLDCAGLILAVPPPAAAALLEGLHPPLAGELRALRSVSSAVVNLAYAHSALRTSAGAFGFVVPASEPSDLLALTWSSAKFNGRAPPGTHLLRAFTGGPGREHIAELPEPELLDRVHAELRRRLGLVAEPLQTWIARWPRANPQYEVGHLERIARIEAMLSKLPRLWLAGGAYRGVGVPDCIRSGRAAAEAAAQLKANSRR
ncbi:MAG: protoporphyrinogen oxidase [Kiritimatiellae bacterium]|nr:protoporphyrinogen oxidase [Kiritimatiellia bacterium]